MRKSLFLASVACWSTKNLLELRVVYHVCSEVVKVVRFSHLVPGFTMYRHALGLSAHSCVKGHGGTGLQVSEFEETTANVGVVVENLKNLFLNSGNFFSHGKPRPYSMS